MSQLFEDLIVEILMRLPVKSLLRFRVVSRSWCALIDSQYFVYMHLKHSINTNTKLHVFVDDDCILNWKTSIYSICFEEGFDEPVTVMDNVLTSADDYEIVGSCNGVLCLCTMNLKLVLWNPFTRRYKKLPIARVSKLPGEKAFSYGFGYDNVSNDYKVVRIIQFYDKAKGHLILRGGEVKVYSLRSHSWKRIQDFPSCGYELIYWGPDRKGCFANGALYWLVPALHKPTAQESKPSPLLVSFNLRDEEFGLVPLPIKANRDDVCLGVLRGCLCFCEEYMDLAEVWMMKQYGVTESWFQLHLLILHGIDFLDPTYRNVKPLAYSKNGEKLLMQTAFDSFHWYDLKDDRDDVLCLEGMPVYFESDMCFESLVSLGVLSKFDGRNVLRRSKRLMAKGSSSRQGR